MSGSVEVEGFRGGCAGGALLAAGVGPSDLYGCELGERVVIAEGPVAVHGVQRADGFPHEDPVCGDGEDHHDVEPVTASGGCRG